jgi:hypothetical protein
MKLYKKVYVKREDKVYCDVCDKLCTDENFGSEYAVLEALWGYASKSDGKRFDIQICEDCFYEIIEWIKTRRMLNHLVDLKESPVEGEN